ncbi:uncharacterized protein EV420DRAFT_1649014 [Desarmillaria tabescens]|uniref:Uncharacterized protein n=1 Tax=Armillaria tabescens TaxID=1929756 RepID=A0AA39JJG3_ARMTA|nr:uncharacterized protein EV420DRAFT_1649014 [Desarmillaria tabescens]KAK0443902.1 hypothetical protein EV420DRAFT_1649014 [Desarmillaria tabescens]
MLLFRDGLLTAKCLCLVDSRGLPLGLAIQTRAFESDKKSFEDEDLNLDAQEIDAGAGISSLDQIKTTSPINFACNGIAAGEAPNALSRRALGVDQPYPRIGFDLDMEEDHPRSIFSVIIIPKSLVHASGTNRRFIDAMHRAISAKTDGSHFDIMMHLEEWLQLQKGSGLMLNPSPTSFSFFPLLSHRQMSGSLILLDDSAFSPGFSPSSLWTQDPGQLWLQQWYQHYSSWAYNSNAGNSTYGSFSVTFEGISIAFTGNTPPGTNKQNFSVFIDGADAYVASYPSQWEYMQWYMSPTLEEGTHTITLTEMDNIDVDYAIVGVGNQTTVLGKDILVDDTSDSIIWTGDWQTNTSTLTHITETYIINHPLGDSFSFEFTGTSVSVFGIRRNSIVGVISADFSVDGGKTTTFSTTSTRSGSDLANTVLFSSPILSSGIHTLIMNITVVAGDQSLKLDYITYSDQVSDSNGSPSPSSSSTSSSRSNLPSGSSASYSPPKTTAFKGIVGGSVGGGIILLLVIAGTLFWWRRKKQAYHKANLISLSEPFPYTPEQSVPRQTQPSVPTPSTTEQNFKTWRQSRGMSVVVSASTAGSSHVSPSSPTLSLPRSASENQAEIRRRPDEINSLIAQIEQPSNEMTQIQELQNRIEMLTEENTRLMGVPPPAYGD